MYSDLDPSGLPAADSPSREFRFSGAFESVSDDGILWIRNAGLTVRADLNRAKTYLFANTGREENFTIFDPSEIPEQINRNRISGLAGDAKVFVGGTLVTRENRRIFASLPEAPLLVIFFEGQEKALSVRAVRAGRHRNEFFNFLTPYAFILGSFSQILIAITYLTRPAYRMILAAALIALFTPVLPWLPPGILFTFVYRRLWFRARIYRAYRDLARFPLAYISGVPADGVYRGKLPDGENFCIREYNKLPDQALPFLIPAAEKRPADSWYAFGAVPDGKMHAEGWPSEPADAFAVAGILPGNPQTLAVRYTRKAYILEIISWIFLACGIGLNLFFIRMILELLVNV